MHRNGGAPPETGLKNNSDHHHHPTPSFYEMSRMFSLKKELAVVLGRRESSEYQVGAANLCQFEIDALNGNVICGHCQNNYSIIFFLSLGNRGRVYFLMTD